MRESDISAWAPFHGAQRTHSARLNGAAHDSSAVIIATGVPGLKLEPRGRGPFGAALGPGVSPPVLGAPRCREVPVAPGSALAHAACGQGLGIFTCNQHFIHFPTVISLIPRDV